MALNYKNHESAKNVKFKKNVNLKSVFSFTGVY